MSSKKFDQSLGSKIILFKRIIFLASGSGVLLSAYMWYLKVTAVHFRCLISSCSAVMASTYSTMLGVPVPVYGFFYYAFLITLTFIILLHQKFDQITGKILWAFILLGDIFTIYLRYLELAKMHEWCELCWTSVIILLVINILWWQVWKKETSKTI